MVTDIKDTKPESPTSRRGARLPSFGGILMFVALLALLAVLAVAAGLVRGWWPTLNPFTTATIDRSSPVVLRSLEDLAEFHASSGHFEVIVDLEEDTKFVPSWVSGERVLFVGVGTVDSVVSFEGLDESQILVSDDGKSVTIQLPAPELEEPQIDVDLSYVYVRERGVLERVGGLFGGQSVDQPLYQQAVEKMRNAAAADGQVLALGEQNTTSTLRGMLRALGFTSVDVVYG